MQKVEWVECFIEARERAITKDNILSGWRGVGLFPENMHRILIQISVNEVSAPTPASATNAPALMPFLATSSPPDYSSLHSTNQAFLAEFSKCEIPQNSCATLEWYLRKVA